jgi:hypothetical protein
MKLEYLNAGSPDCPLIRLYDFTAAEAALLLSAVTALASGAVERIDMDRLPYIEPVGGCQLALMGQAWDQAIARESGPAGFVCGLTADSWDNVAGLVEPFAIGASGFQWLVVGSGEAALLLSSTGLW